MTIDPNKLISYGELTGGEIDLPYLSYRGEQILTQAEKKNALTKLGIASEQMNLTINCENPSDIMGAIVTIVCNGDTRQYIWEGQTIIFVAPIGSEYAITFSDIVNYTPPDSRTYKAEEYGTRNVTVSYTRIHDLSLLGINGENLTTRSTANCYVIKNTGAYIIPLVYGNGITSGATNSQAYTRVTANTGNTQPFYNYLNNQITSPFIETDTGVEAVSGEIAYSDVPTSDFAIKNLTIVQGELCRFLRFEVTAFPPLGGNAVLAIKDGSGQIMWSWHIWAYADTLTTKAHRNTNGYTYNMLDVNLGWVKDSSGSKYGSCPYYEWGRKDPMLRSVNSSTSSASTVGYGSYTSIGSVESVAAAIQNPNAYIQGSYRTWLARNGGAINFLNYWDASQTTVGLSDKTIIKTIYDPCPAGYAVPCGNTFLGFTKSNGGTWDRGYTWDGRYFPAMGYYTGAYQNVGSYGNYRIISFKSLPTSDSGAGYFLRSYSGTVETYASNAQTNWAMPIVPIHI